MLIDRITPYAGSFSLYTELRATENIRYSYTSTANGGVETLNMKNGVCARVLKNNVYGLAASQNYDDESVRAVLRRAEENADAMGAYARFRGRRIPELPSGIAKLNNPVKELDRALVRSIMDAARAYATETYPQLQEVEVWCWNESCEKYLAVQTGLSGHANRILGGVSVVMRGENSRGEPVRHSCEEAISAYITDFFTCEAEVRALVDRCWREYERELEYSYQEKVEIPGGIHDVILSPEFTGMLAHEAVGHTCEADAVSRENSVCSAFMGQQVASELVSLTDFAFSAYGETCPIPLYMDDEGTPCRDAKIIENGVLVGCMTNRELAERLGYPATGNARASEPADEPIIRMRNTCFLKGESHLEDMIASIDHGYYLTRSGGGNGSLKGEFNMQVSEGYEIVGGKLGRRVQQTVCSGLAWDALKTVTMVSDHFVDSKSCGTCGKKQSIPTSQGGPEMKLRMAVSGK